MWGKHRARYEAYMLTCSCLRIIYPRVFIICPRAHSPATPPLYPPLPPPQISASLHAALKTRPIKIKKKKHHHHHHEGVKPDGGDAAHTAGAAAAAAAAAAASVRVAGAITSGAAGAEANGGGAAAPAQKAPEVKMEGKVAAAWMRSGGGPLHQAVPVVASRIPTSSVLSSLRPLLYLVLPPRLLASPSALSLRSFEPPLGCQPMLFSVACTRACARGTVRSTNHTHTSSSLLPPNHPPLGSPQPPHPPFPRGCRHRAGGVRV